MVTYAELHAHSAYSFLDGASLPEDLVRRAVELELSAIGLTDHDGFPGIVRFTQAAREYGIPTVIGTELALDQEPRSDSLRHVPDPVGKHVVLLADGPDGYSSLSSTIAQAQLATGRKQNAFYTLEGLAQASRGQWHVLTGCRKGHLQSALHHEGIAGARYELGKLVSLFGRDRVAVEITDYGQPLDKEINQSLVSLSKEYKVDVVATGNVHYARESDRPLADVLAAVRARKTLMEIDPWLPASPRILRAPREMARIHRNHGFAVERAASLGNELAFDLDLVAPQLPKFPVPAGHTEDSWLRVLVEGAASQVYGDREDSRAVPAWKQIDRELEIISALGFPGYFLIVHEIVEFCRQNDIFCQGRGSAANSAVCFALGITAVDAVKHQMLFERFLSPHRSGPPDIDIDIESGRREEVIQHVYQRYGRTHAAQVANVITYRPRSAIRDVGRAFGIEQGRLDSWARSIERWSSLKNPDDGEGGASRQVSDDLSDIDEQVVHIAEQALTLPRHLGIHSGGMVMCDRPVIEVCPVSWATMPGRTVLQWDKEDCADAGLVKFDLLGLGMLTALRLAFKWLETLGHGRYDLHSLPYEDSRVYDLLCAADTVGVFQVESRAQMSTLPRLQPRCFYDIVIEVALIRPGPIQGNAVNPYIARRRGREPVTYLHPLLKPALEKTLGVPIFQEQLMHIAVDVAGFSAADADALRKAMGSKRSVERMEALRAKLFAGMEAKGISADVAEQIYASLLGFADFGFPESHAFSFAYLVYASAWLKVHFPEAFYCSLLNAQPMGFYSPQSLVADARRHGIRVARPDINYSQVEASLEKSIDRVQGESVSTAEAGDLVDPDPHTVLRLGLASVKGIGDAAERIVAEREHGKFQSLADLAHRCRLSESVITALSESGCCLSLGKNRREGMWVAGAVGVKAGNRTTWFQPTIPGTEIGVNPPELPAMGVGDEVVADVRVLGMSVDYHPITVVREELHRRGIKTIAEMSRTPTGERVRVAGVVTHRQRPHTAHGIIFLSIEDETGMLNIVCSSGLWSAQKKIAGRSRALIIRGMLERADGATNFVADGFEDLPLRSQVYSRDFR